MFKSNIYRVELFNTHIARYDFLGCEELQILQQLFSLDVGWSSDFLERSRFQSIEQGHNRCDSHWSLEDATFLQIVELDVANTQGVIPLKLSTTMIQGIILSEECHSFR